MQSAEETSDKVRGALLQLSALEEDIVGVKGAAGEYKQPLSFVVCVLLKWQNNVQSGSSSDSEPGDEEIDNVKAPPHIGSISFEEGAK